MPVSKEKSASRKRGIEISRAVTICRPADALYSFWRDLHNIEGCLPDGIAVKTKSPRLSPGGHVVEWDTEIVRDEPDRAIAWRSLGGAGMDNSGSVRFEPVVEDENATNVTLAVRYSLPGGLIGQAIGEAASGRAEREVAAGLQRVKQRLESEE